MMKILGMTGGEHSCGLSVTYDGKPILALEEERHSRTKAYNDLYNNIYRYPWESGQNVWFIKDWDWLDLDYITSPETPEVFERIWAGIGLGPFPREKYIKVNHHEAHCTLAYYCSGFKEDTLVVSIDASGELFNARFYLGEDGNLTPISGNENNRKSLGHYYAMLTEFLGFKRLKDEGKVVGMASHGSFNQEIYDIFSKIIQIQGLNTDYDTHIVPGGGIYQTFYSLWFQKFGSRYTK